MTQIFSQCGLCGRFRGGNLCSSFPDGIPPAVQWNEHDHREPFPGDGGAVFLPADREAVALQAELFAAEEDDGGVEVI